MSEVTPRRLAITVAFGMLFVDAVQAQTTVQIWRRWTKALTSSMSYDNPMVNQRLRVTFNGPSAQTYRSLGYHDGGNTFRIRFMFDEVGTWNWSTTFSDTSNSGLHNQSGTVSVTAYTSSNPLYEHGYIRPSSANRYLEHADGTPFLWVGDTPWAAIRYATDSQWSNYITNRNDKNINVLHMGTLSIIRNDINATDAEGNRFFTNANPLTIHHAGWRNFEDKVERANSDGLLVHVCGMVRGLRRTPDSQVRKFAEYLAARLAGNHVVLSPYQNWGCGHEALARTSGSDLDTEFDLPLISQHLLRGRGCGQPYATGAEWTLGYYHDRYQDFVGVQTGHGDNLGDRAPISGPTQMNSVAQDHIQWVDQLYAENPHKPLIVNEGLYESKNGAADKVNNQRMLRRQIYWSILNGAYGHSSSTHAIWGWGAVWGAPPLSEGLLMPYADWLGHMNTFFSDIDWWRLTPNHESLIQNQASAWRRRMMLAKTSSGDLAVAYLPDNSSIQISMGSFPGHMEVTWFRTTNAVTTYGDTVPNSGVQTFNKPCGWDDTVLLLVAAQK